MSDQPETGEVREVGAGAEFEVVLSVPGGTGYRWEVATVAEGTKVVGESPAQAVEDSRPGSPRAQRFVLRAGTASGRALFLLRRPWESNPVREHAVDIRVRP
ncbi:protease inhibitor I42 family protein [Sinomonas susongensis]|uniref:protease inhibitor I42 family protein n=1 Tax=Sinomonas susongensis TaxID=1324851 RepID=UPI001485C602|nr:protease inhibitor I42 family protein [Sinomonas susongensis]